MKLHAVSDGPPSLSVRMLLKALNVSYDLVNVDFNSGEHLTDEYAKMNPQKEIPVLEDDGFYLSEHIAIMQYIADKYAPETPLYPKEAKARALVNQRLCFNMAFFYPSIAAYAMAPIFFTYERTPEGLKKVHHSLSTFETYLKRQNSKYAAGNSLTMADFPLIASVICLEAIGVSLADYPLITAWYENFKKQHAEIWEIAEGGMKEIIGFNEKTPDLSKLNHPFHPVRK